VTLGNEATDVVTVTGKIAGTNALKFDGSTVDTNYLTLAVSDASAGGATVTIPAEDGGTLLTQLSTVATAITSTGVLDDLTVTGAVIANGAVTLGNEATDVVTVTGTSTFAGAITANGAINAAALTAEGIVILGSATDDVTVKKDLTILKDLTVKRNMEVEGELKAASFNMRGQTITVEDITVEDNLILKGSKDDTPDTDDPPYFHADAGVASVFQGNNVYMFGNMHKHVASGTNKYSDSTFVAKAGKSTSFMTQVGKLAPGIARDPDTVDGSNDIRRAQIVNVGYLEDHGRDELVFALKVLYNTFNLDLGDVLAKYSTAADGTNNDGVHDGGEDDVGLATDFAFPSIDVNNYKTAAECSPGTDDTTCGNIGVGCKWDATATACKQNLVKAE